MNSKILITGANGFIGSAISNKLSWVGHTVYRSVEDIRSKEVLKNIGFEPDIVIHTAAISKVPTCNNDPNWCLSVNVGGTKNVINRFPDAKFIFFSSYAVYSKLNGQSTETDPADNEGFCYSITKVLGEKLVRDLCKDYIIYRPSVMFGFHDKKTSGKNYLMILMDNIKNGVVTKSPDDQYFNPISREVVVEIVSRSIEKDLKGIYNLGCSDIISKYEFNRKLINAFGYDRKLLVKDTAEDPVRIKHATILSGKIQKDLSYTIPSLDAMIDKLTYGLM